MNPAQRLLKRKTQERAMALMMERQRLKRKTRPQANDPEPGASDKVVLDSADAPAPVLRQPGESRLAFEVRLHDSPVTETRIGVWDGYCNRRSACRQPHARWWNRGSYSHYCFDCAHMLNSDPFNEREAREMFGGTLCIEMDSAVHWPHGEPRYHHPDDVLPDSRY